MSIRHSLTAGCIAILCSSSVHASPDSIAGDIASENANTSASGPAAKTQGGLRQEVTQDNVSLATGEWEVTPSGSFNYTIPIEVPAGRGGVQPDLALVYDSQNPNGLMGMGFALRGLPAIVRIPHAKGIRYQGDDTFALNYHGWGTPTSPTGRLVRVEGGPHDGTYHTAVESWMQFRAFGSCGQGPCFWEMKDGSGKTYHFGGAIHAKLNERNAGLGPARGIQAWALTGVSDLHGNSYRVEYTKDEWMMYPSRIAYDCSYEVTDTPPFTPTPGEPVTPEWPTTPDIPVTPGTEPVVLDTTDGTNTPTGTPTINIGTKTNDSNSASVTPTNQTSVPVTISLDDPPIEDPLSETEELSGQCDTPTREIVFDYNHNRPDPSPAPHQHHRTLRSITIKSLGQVIRSYQLEYEPSPGLARLASIQEHGRVMGATFPAKTFLWTPESNQAFGPFGPHTATKHGVAIQAHRGDINSDGFEDFVRVSLGESLNVWYQLGSTSGLGAAAHFSQGEVTFRVVDEDGNRDDVRVRVRHDWGSLLTDINADGNDDLVVWYAGDGEAFLQYALGERSGSFGPLLRYSHSRFLYDFAQHTVGPLARRTYRMIDGDFNGDQITDLVLLNQHTLAMAFFPGSTNGLGPLIVHANDNAEATYRWRNEPVITDINGDGFSDIVLSHEWGNGVRTAYAMGRPEGLTPITLLPWGTNGPASAAPYQIINGDINGDHIGDLTLAYSGPTFVTGSTGGARPYARDIRSLLGDTTLLTGSPTWIDHIRTSSITPSGYNPSTGEFAYWQHHGADINCDGMTDVVLYYGGSQGQRVEWMIATGNGGLDSVQTSPTLNTAPSAAHLVDGARHVHRWQSRMLDVNEDGCSDFARFYAGNQGIFIDIAYGTPTGLSSTYQVRIAHPSAITESGDSSQLERKQSVKLLTPDANGDGRVDLVLSTYEDVFIALSTPGLPNLLAAIDNGYGSTVEIDYQSSAKFTNAIAPNASCAHNIDCGIPAKTGRPLVFEIRQQNGRGVEQTTSYDYVDGRYYPGPLVAAFAVHGRHARADLGFASVSDTHEQTNITTTVYYRRDWPFHRRARLIETHHQAPGLATTLYKRETLEYYDNITNGDTTTQFGTSKVQLARRTTDLFELNTLAHTIIDDYQYNDLGAAVMESSNTDGWIYETHTSYTHDLDPNRWILNRVAEVKIRPQRENTVTAWQKFLYQDDLLTEEKTLLCNQDYCPCFTTDIACLEADARWVVTAHGHEYDDYGNLLAVADALSRTVHYTYDPDFATYVKTTTRKVGVSSKLSATSDQSTTASSFNLPFDEKRTAEPVPVQKIPISFAPPRSLTITKTYDYAGRLETETDANGNTTQYIYDDLGRLETVSFPNGGRTSYSYIDWGDPYNQYTEETSLTHVDSQTGQEHSLSSRRYFDGDGDIYRQESQSATTHPVVHLRNYYFSGGRRFDLISQPHFDNVSSADITWNLVESDPLGRPVRVEKRRGATSQGNGTSLGVLRTYSYLPRAIQTTHNAAEVADDGVIQGQNWQTSTFEMDGRGLLTRVIDATGAGTIYTYDNGQRLGLIAGPHPSLGGPVAAEPAVGFCITFRCRIFDYDNWGRRIESHDSDTGSTTYTYDLVGNLASRMDALGRETTYRHDELNRPTLRSNSDGPVFYRYDLGVPNGLGRLTRIDYPAGQTIIQGYDAVGNATVKEYRIHGLSQGYTEQFRFDLSGRLIGKDLPDGTALQYKYNDGGALSHVLVAGVEYASFSDYNAFGSVGRRTIIPGTTNYAYTSDGLLQSIQSSTNNGYELQNYFYEHDTTGNILGIIDDRTHKNRSYLDWRTRQMVSTSTEDTWRYTYDKANRLTSASFRGHPKTHYAYNTNGDLTQRGDVFIQHNGDTITANYYPPQPPGTGPCLLVPGQPIPPNCTYTPVVPQFRYQGTYDTVGNLVSKTTPISTRSYEYDLESRLVGVQDNGLTTATFAYDARGRRIKKVARGANDDVTTYYLGDSFEIREHSTSPGTFEITRNIAAPGQGLVASITTNQSQYVPLPYSLALAIYQGNTLEGLSPGTRYYFGNHLGSSSVITNNIGMELVRYVYRPWGDIDRQASFGQDVVTRKFTGQEHDAATGLIYYRSRYYDPGMARFLSADSVLAGGKWDPIALNRYAYARANPAKYIDPDGHIPVLYAIAITLGMAISMENHQNVDITGFMPGGVQVAASLAQIGDVALGLYQEHQAIQVQMDELVAEFHTEESPDSISYQTRYVQLMKQQKAVEERALKEGAKQAFNQVLSFATHKMGQKWNASRGPSAAPKKKSKSSPKRRTSQRKPKSATKSCFTEGTLVATANGPVPIQDIRLGDRVLSLGGMRDSTDIHPTTWRWVTVEMPNPDGSGDVIDLELLRPLEWLQATGAQPGAQIHFVLEEMDLNGPATILAVHPIPEIEDGPGEIVTATINHFNSYVMEMELEGTKEILEPTRRHPLFSADRNAWVQAGQLRPGERLVTPNGPVTIRSIAEKKGVHRVFNLEVDDSHSYLVGELGVWAHNSCPEGLGNIGSHGPMSVNDALRHGLNWVGKGYKEMGPKGSGVFRSADGRRQFRMTDADLAGSHGNMGPHIHFEALDKRGKVIENLHIPLRD